MQAAGLITNVNDEDLTTLAGRVKWARKKRELSQAALAKAAGVSQGTIGNVESGERKKPRELVSIARALRVFPAWLDTARGDWDASAAPESIFDALTEDEKELLENFRSLMDEDRDELRAEIEHRAEKIRTHMEKVLSRVGIPPRAPRTAAARARQSATRTTSVDVVQQQRLPLGPGGGGSYVLERTKKH